MDKNTITGLVLIFFILLGFSFFQSRKAREAQALNAGTISETYELTRPDTRTAQAQQASVIDTAAASAYKDSLLCLAYADSASVVTLENDKFVVEFTTRGAQPLSVRLKEYYNYDSTDLYIFRPGNAEYAIGVYAGEYIKTTDFNFKVSALTDTTVVFSLPFSNGGSIEQVYSIAPGSYSLNNELRFVGMDNLIPKNVSSFDIDFKVSVPRMEKGYKNEVQYSKLNYYFEGDKKPVEIGKGRNADKRIESRFSWFAFQQQFFSAIMRAPKEFASGELAVNFHPEDASDGILMDCSAEMRADYKSAPELSVPFEFYFGPNSFHGLQEYDHKYEKIIPLGGWLVGWFTRFAIIPMFNFLNRFIDNFGLIILIMTIVIKTVVLPLTYKSYASSAKMAALRPEIDKLNEKYPHTDNQQEMLKKQQATMNLYKRAGVSPVGGCLPMLLTFPILWAMFRFFPASIELRQQPFLWCHDLSAYDSIWDYGVRIPILGDHLSLFALLMAATMWLYSKMMMKSQPKATDPTASSMQFMTLWMMPIMMFFICNSVSAALSYYYFISQLISIFQTWIIRRSIKPEKVLAKLKESEGKPIPKSKWQQRLEAAQKLQEQQMRKRK